jgi:hypothetical protein
LVAELAGTLCGGSGESPVIVITATIPNAAIPPVMSKMLRFLENAPYPFGWQFFIFFPLPQGHRSFRPACWDIRALPEKK